jgi:hypothetical protein
LFPDRWDKAVGKWKVAPDKRPTLAQAFKRFHEGIRFVSRDKLTGLVTLDIEWEEPLRAAEWANELTSRLNSEMRARAIARTSASLGFLEKELSTTAAVETRQAISRLVEVQINQRMLANVTHEYAFRVVDRALPPDLGDPVRPRKALLLILGPVVGFVLGVVAVVTSAALRGRL